MAAGDVRELLVELRLGNQQFKKAITSAKQDLSLLQAQFKATQSASGMDLAAETFQVNLQNQINAVGEMITAYETRIKDLRQALTQTTPGTAQEAGLLGDLKKTETYLQGAQEKLNELEAKLKTFNLENFRAAMEEIVGVTRDLDLAYNSMIGDWANETADSADAVKAAREQLDARLGEAANLSKDDPALQQLQQWTRDLIATEIPLAYEEVAAIEKTALEAGISLGQPLEEFTRVYSMLAGVSDSLTGESGATQLAQISRLLRVGAEDYKRLGASIAYLADTTTASEAQIIEITGRAASTGGIFNLAASDLLAFSAAAADFGMQDEAGGSSITRVLTQMGEAALMAGDDYKILLDRIRDIYPNLRSVYDLQNAKGAGEASYQPILALTGYSQEDFDSLVDRAVTLEKYAQIMGVTADQFGQAWRNDPGEAFLQFWERLGEIDQAGAGSAVSLLESLGITNIRDSLLAKNFATMDDFLRQYVTLSEEAWNSGDALEKKAATIFNTTESRRVMRENIRNNLIEGVGEGVLLLREPFEALWADIQKNFTENMPAWVVQGAGVAVAALGELGNLITGVGDVAEGVYYTAEVASKLKNTNWTRIINALGPAAAKIAPVAIGAAGMAGAKALVDWIDGMNRDISGITEGLKNIEISIDPESKNSTLAAIAQVREAVEELSGQEREDLDMISRAVRAGYGDEEMYGQALGYARAGMEEEMRALSASYGAQIDELNRQIVAASETGNEGLAKELQGQREVLKENLAKEQEDVEAEYGRTISSLFEGMTAQRQGLLAQAERISQDYPLLATLLGLETGAIERTDENLQTAWNAMAKKGLITWEEAQRNFAELSWGGTARSYDFRDDAKAILDGMMEAMEALAGDSDLAAWYASILEGGLVEGLDLGYLEGPLAAFMGTLRLREGVLAGGDKNLYLLGDYLYYTLSQSVENAGDKIQQLIPALQEKTTDAMQTAFGMDSSSNSGVTEAQGLRIARGWADGIYSGEAAVIAAIQHMGEMAAQEAAAQAAKVNAILGFGAGGGGSAGYSSGHTGGSAGNTITQYFNLSGGGLETQQNIKRLAQEVARVQRNVNAGVGKG